mgnify:FL=1
MPLLSSTENRDGTPNIALRKVANKFCRSQFIFPCFNLENFIVGLDFNPPGELVATFDRYGVCLISDVNNNSYSFHTDMKMNDLRGN